MLNLDEAKVLQEAINLAKAVCSNPSSKIYPDAESGKDVADFIEAIKSQLLKDNSLSNNK